MGCDCLEVCPFFNDRMKHMPTLSGVLKQRFCSGDYPSCARHLVFVEYGREGVPSDLFPDETYRVAEILAAHDH